MKRLFILRHALTQTAAEGGDRERKLTMQGEQDALLLGERMKDESYIPEFILCSPVTRTRQTLDQVLETLGKIPTEFEKMIYEGGYQDIVKRVHGIDDAISALLVVGHNPSIHQFAASMAMDDGSILINDLARGYAPCTLTVLEVPRASWRDLQPGANKLIDLIVP